MYTGIVTALGAVEELRCGEAGGRIRVGCDVAGELARGDSIAVDGCCLTVTACDERGFSADLSRETLRLTAFEGRGVGAAVNLERPLRAGDRLGGHIVQGHVDGLAELVELGPDGEGYRLVVRIPAPLRRYVALKGSLALDGISLTVAAYHDGQAEVAVIPYTFQNTALHERRPGDPLHLEVDVLARYVEALTRPEEA